MRALILFATLVLPWLVGVVVGLDWAWRGYHGLFATWWWPFRFLGSIAALSIGSALAGACVTYFVALATEARSSKGFVLGSGGVLLMIGLQLYVATDLWDLLRPSPSVWTAESLKTFGLDPQFVRERYTSQGLSEAMADGVHRCVTAKFKVAVPGGPRQAKELGRDRFVEIAKGVGADCKRELARSVLRSTTWTADFGSLFVDRCVVEFGEVGRPGCSCVAQTAPKYFASPASFMGTLDLSKEKRDKNESLGKIALACAPPSPE